MQKIGVFKCLQSYNNNSIKDNEFHHTYIVELKVPLHELTLQINEVDNVKLVTFDAFNTILNNIGKDNHFVPSNKAYYRIVLERIKDKFN